MYLGENQLLCSLNEDAFALLQPHIRPTLLDAKQIVYPARTRVRHVYFPETAVICMLTVMQDGRSVESATVGREGALWISATVGAPSMPCQTMVAVSGRAQRLAIEFVEQEIQKNGTFHRALTRYSHALLIQVLRTGSCNALHTLEQRSARWMLTTLDRTGDQTFAVTHEFLASLVGCGRPVLTRILSDLEKSGAIELHRGSIHVLRRYELERYSCECYQIIRQNHLAC